MRKYFLVLNYFDYKPQLKSWEIPYVFHNWDTDRDLTPEQITTQTRELFIEFVRDTDHEQIDEANLLVIEFSDEVEFMDSFALFEKLDNLKPNFGRDEMEEILRILTEFPKYNVVIRAKTEEKKPEPKSFWS